MQAALKRFARNRMALFGATVLLVLLALVIACPLVYPGDPFRLAGPPLQPPDPASCSAPTRWVATLQRESPMPPAPPC
jgi:hypothetical protein